MSEDDLYVDERLLRLEFAYNTYDQSCRDPYVVSGESVECRRGDGHIPNYHACMKTAETFYVWPVDEY